MKGLPTSSPLLRALRGTIATLPAYQAAADAPPPFTEVGIRYTQYSEDALDDDRVIFGSTDRYDIDVTQLWLEVPVGARWSVALDYQNDYQTGASPWFVGQSAPDVPGVIMSGASIKDNRVEVGVATRYYWAEGNAGFSLTRSEEDDYKALAFALDVAWNSDDNSRTWSASMSTSSDTVEPERGVIPVFIDQEDIDTRSGYFGVSQILSQTAIVKIGLSYTFSEGYLTDPYKLNDARPDEHKRTVLSAGYRKFVIDADGILSADYRFYSDDWGVDSHTAEIAWTQNLSTFSVTPYFRYYSQSQADFFSVIADTSSRFYADDYRLSAFGALTTGLRGEWQLGAWKIEAQAERYRSANDWSLSSGEQAPALVSFWRGTLGLSWQFD